MYGQIYTIANTVTIEIDDEELIEKVLNSVEDLIKSAVFHHEYDAARDYINFFLKLESVYKELVKDHAKKLEDVCD